MCSGPIPVTVYFPNVFHCQQSTCDQSTARSECNVFSHHQEQQVTVCQMLQRQRELQRLTLSGALAPSPNSPMMAQSPGLLSSATASPLQGGQGGGGLFGLQDNTLHKAGVSRCCVSHCGWQVVASNAPGEGSTFLTIFSLRQLWLMHLINYGSSLEKGDISKIFDKLKLQHSDVPFPLFLLHSTQIFSFLLHPNSILDLNYK